MPANSTSFFDAIGSSGLKEKITPSTPWVYFSMEAGLNGLSFEGGLGILAADLYLQAKKSNIPFVLVTLLYPTSWEQNLENFYQKEHYFSNSIEEDFKHEADVEIKANEAIVPVQVFIKKEGTATIVGLYEPGLRELYADATTSEHRLFQEAVLGFGGFAALKKLGLSPAIIHMNEAATVFSLLAYLDGVCMGGLSLEQGIKKAREISIFTNHTLVAAAVASFSKEFYENYVLKNIKSEVVRGWLLKLLSLHDNTLRRTTIAIELSGHLNGVSTMHSAIANMDCKTVNGQACSYHPITNGIFLERWTHDSFYQLYHKTQLLDEFDLVQPRYADMTASWTQEELLGYKNTAKKDLIEYLKERVDQYGNPIRLKKDAKIAVWAKRLAGYKRPDMLFADIERLLQIINREDFYILLAGNVHPGDEIQKQQLKSIFSAIDANPLLREKVIYIQRYNIPLAQRLVKGADMWINVPEVGKEACGTSWMKALSNLAIIISTKDGGVSDIPDDAYMLVHGETYEKEVDALYENIARSCELLEKTEDWRKYVINQLQKSLSVISSARMVKDYLTLVYK